MISSASAISCRLFSSLSLAWVTAGGILFSLAPASLTAAEDADQASATISQEFKGKGLPPGFGAVKGEWKIVDGALVGAELESDKHAGVLNFGTSNTDSEISLRVRFDGADFFHLSLNHAKGHLFRVVLTPDGMAINKDKDKKDPESKAMELAKSSTPIAAGEWHTLTVVIHGESVSASLDSQAKLEASHPGLKMEKTGYRLIVKGKSIAIDDIQVKPVSAGK